MTIAPNSVALFTPEAILNVYANALITGLDRSQLLVVGIYQPTGRKPYGVYYYDTLKDETSDYQLTIRVPEAIRTVLQANERYVLRGFLNKQAKAEGRIDLVFSVTELIGREERQLPPEALRQTDILRCKMEQGYRDPTQAIRTRLLAGGKVRLAAVFGVTGIVDQDLQRALGAAQASYAIQPLRVNLSSVTAIIENLKKLDAAGYDLIAVVRGGGSGLDVFDNLDLAEAASMLKTPWVTALGHADDKPFLEKVADRSFETPSILGTFLQRVVDELSEEMTSSRATLMQQIETSYQARQQQIDDQYQRSLQNLTAQLERLQTENGQAALGQVIVYIILALVVGFVLGYLTLTLLGS